MFLKNGVVKKKKGGLIHLSALGYMMRASYPNQSKSRSSVLPILNKNCNYFLFYLGFFGVHMGLRSKIKRSQLRLALLFQNPHNNVSLLVKQFW